MDLNLSKVKILKVILEVGEFKLRLPNMAQVKVFQDDMRKAGKGDGSGALICIQALLDELGMPVKASDTLDMEQMEALVEALMPKKKA